MPRPYIVRTTWRALLRLCSDYPNVTRFLWPLVAGIVVLLVACGPAERIDGPTIEITPPAVPKQPRPDQPALRDLPTPAIEEVSPVSEMEQAVREQVNGIRQEHRLQPLERHAELAEVARAYSCRMAEETFVGHVSPEGEGPAHRVREAGISFQAVGENIGFNINAPNPVEQAVQGWMESEGHRENILRDVWTHTGVGVCQRGAHYYFTQLFMRPL